MKLVVQKQEYIEKHRHEQCPFDSAGQPSEQSVEESQRDSTDELRQQLAYNGEHNCHPEEDNYVCHHLTNLRIPSDEGGNVGGEGGSIEFGDDKADYDDGDRGEFLYHSAEQTAYEAVENGNDDNKVDDVGCGHRIECWNGEMMEW